MKWTSPLPSPCRVIFSGGGDDDRQRLDSFRDLLEFLIRPESMTWLEGDDKPLAATQLVGEMELLVPMAGLIDKDAELARLDKEIERRRNDKERAEGKINNPNFVDRAPDAVVQKEKDKLSEIESALAKLSEQRDSVAAL